MPDLWQRAGADLKRFGGILQCSICQTRRNIGDVSDRLERGWPKCCGATMTWWTQRQIDGGALAVSSPANSHTKEAP